MADDIIFEDGDAIFEDGDVQFQGTANVGRVDVVLTLSRPSISFACTQPQIVFA